MIETCRCQGAPGTGPVMAGAMAGMIGAAGVMVGTMRDGTSPGPLPVAKWAKAEE